MNKHIVLKQRQSLSLDSKIALSKKRIREWLDFCDGDAYVAFSGGKDSSVLLHLVWSIDPSIPAVFSDTGLEMPEIRTFVKSVSSDGLISNSGNLCGPVERVRPIKNFKRVIEEDGYPLLSKKLAKTLRILKEEKDNPRWSNTYRLYDTGIKKDGSFSKISKLPNKWRPLVSAPFKVSESCCNHLKKEPLDTFAKITGRKPFMGIMASEGGQRASSSSTCNAYDQSKPRSAPLLFWTDKDIWDYISLVGLHICDVYYERVNSNGVILNPEKRTGCMFCMFGVHMEKGENRFQRMYKSHPRHWDTCINKLGLREPLDFINVKYIPDDLEVCDVSSSKTSTTSTHGGKRSGAGRKKGIETKLMRVPVEFEHDILFLIAKLKLERGYNLTKSESQALQIDIVD